ncbi:MAG: AbrB/MazE/SpoVT family DNA-binding domain-containing protein [Methanobacteriota archaeon]
MSEAELVKISPRGQIVIPKDIREVLGLEGGERFAVKAQGDVILLKRVEIPELKESWGESFAREKGIKEEDVGKVIHRRRGVKG